MYWRDKKTGLPEEPRIRVNIDRSRFQNRETGRTNNYRLFPYLKWTGKPDDLKDQPETISNLVTPRLSTIYAMSIVRIHQRFAVGSHTCQDSNPVSGEAHIDLRQGHVEPVDE